MKFLIRAILKWALRDELWEIKALAGALEQCGTSNYPYESKMLRARVHALERHLKVTNEFHHAEMSHPYDGFKWMKMERHGWPHSVDYPKEKP